MKRRPAGGAEATRRKASPSRDARVLRPPAPPVHGLQRRLGNRGVGRLLQRAQEIEPYVASLFGRGEPLPESARAQMEARLGTDLGDVRVHTDSAAAESAQRVDAAAYTIGDHIVFGRGQYAPHTPAGQRLLAHELTHTVQQKHSPELRRTIQRASLAQFRADLEAMSADHQTVIGALFAHPRFIPLANFLNGCPSGTIEFDVRRLTMTVQGRQVDLFGGFSPGTQGARPTPASMIVNPRRAEHASNPLEVVDTIVHEFQHAALGLQAACQSAANPFPLAASILDVPRDPELAALRAEAARLQVRADDRSMVADAAARGITTTSGGDLLEYFDRNYGPSASRPQTHYIDLNRQGLELVTGIIRDIHQAHPGIGSETVSFDNVELMQAEALLASRSWWNATQRRFSMGLHKDRVARKRNIDPASFTEREYDISAIHTVEFADSRTLDPNTGGGWGPVGGVWECHKRSRFTGKTLHTYVTGSPGTPPGGAVGYLIIQHT
jgi:hypothetical protein